MKRWLIPLIILSVCISKAQTSSQSLENLISQRIYLSIGDQTVETDAIKKLYQLNGYQFLWVDKSQKTPQAIALKEALLKSYEHGLDPQIYWTEQTEKLFQNLNERNSLTFEILMSDVYVRYATHLIRGQIQDPDLIDEDIKMKSKVFNEYQKLIDFLKAPQNLSAQLDSLAPQTEQYKKLKAILQKLNSLEWGTFQSPGGDIKPGQSHAMIPEIKKRLNDLGYKVSNQTTVFDSDLEAAVKRFQTLNSIPASKNLNNRFYQAIISDLQTRKNQIIANMEKLRWFPQKWDSSHVFVNLAFQEANVVENEKTVLSMRTVNGRPTRRTPTLIDEIRYVNPYPTWGVPWSIAVKDKLSSLKRNPQEIINQNIEIYNSSNQLVSPFSVNWSSITRNNFPYRLVQTSGPHNALGLVKFPLTNPWAIYLHDTNEPQKLKDASRLYSSGCVRLEKPWELAEYLLKDQAGFTKQKMLTPQYKNKAIFTRKPLPVYFVYLTVDESATGEIRFAQDYYGQDLRLLEPFRSRSSNEKF
jgi:murein L,D-transpeptidase YcbB/YkuD